MIRLVAAGLLVACIPGAIALRLPLGNRSFRERLDWDERAFWAIVLSVAWSAGAAFALAAVGGYTFDRLLLVNAVAVAVPALILRSRLRYAAATGPGPAALVPALVLGLAFWLYHPPAEYIIGGKDPGVYVNEGIQIAQRGDVITHDELVRSVPRDLRNLFMPPYYRGTYYGIRFMGFFVIDPADGTVVGQFPHLYPAAIAVGYGLEGLTGARYVSSICAALGVLGVFFLSARLVGRPAAAIAAVLLAVNVAEVWFARYPNSEIVTQLLLVAGLLALARATVDGDRFFAPVAALLLGLSLFTRIDSVLAIGAVILAILAQRADGKRVTWLFVLPLAALSGAALLYYSRVLAPYAQRPFMTASSHWLELSAVAIALVATYIVAGRPAIAPILKTWLPRALAAILVILAVYAYFLRTPGGKLAMHDANALRTYAWYVHPAGLGAAVLGMCLVIWRRFWKDPAWLTTAAVYAVFFFYKIQIIPEHFWMARRFLPAILPATMMCIAAVLMEGQGALSLRSLRPRAVPRLALRIALALLLAWTYVEASRPILNHIEYAGFIPRLEALASRINADDLVVVESRNASDLHVLALPLAYIYGKPVLVLNSPKPDKLMFAQFIDWARTRYRNVYFLGGGGTDLLSPTVGVEPVSSDRFTVPEYESRRNAYPTRVLGKEFDYGFYRFVTPQISDQPFVLDVGDRDDLYVVRFHAKEKNRRGTFRWTQRQSYISIPSLNPAWHELVLWMQNGGRPAKAGPARVEVFLGDRSLGAVIVGARIEPYTFSIRDRGANAESTTVRLVTDTWNPRESMGADDNRNLGVIVDRVEVR